ncbi:MAG: hypothetical protein EOO80_01325 [Oxalobacteraceae bacterium]|nr:MAG: hypothetical protein EOO80_01325 [Oxalobacteraceae bacterium]
MGASSLGSVKPVGMGKVRLLPPTDVPNELAAFAPIAALISKDAAIRRTTINFGFQVLAGYVAVTANVGVQRAAKPSAAMNS